MVFLDITQRKQAEAQLTSHTQLRNLSARLESIREEEGSSSPVRSMTIWAKR